MRRAGELLRRCSPFDHLTPAEATILCTFMHRREVARGEVIVRNGDKGDALFIVDSGKAEARLTGRQNGDRIPRPLDPGDFFGEIAILRGIRRTADVVAVTPMTLLELTAADYRHHLSSIAEVANGLEQKASERLAHGAGKPGPSRAP